MPTYATHAGAQLAVLSHTACTVSFFDLATGHRTDIVEVLPQGHELLFDPARRVVYASHTYRSGHYLAQGEKGHEISVIDPDAHKVLDVIDIAPEGAPHGMQLDAAGMLYVSVETGPQGPGAVIAVDPNTGRIAARHSAEATLPHWFSLTRDGRKAYTTNKHDTYVSVLDIADGGPLRRIPVSGSEDLALSADGTRLFVATPTLINPAGDPVVQVVDTATDEIVHSIRLGHLPGPVHVTTDGKVLVGQWRVDGDPMAGPRLPGLLSVFDATTFELVAEVDVDCGPLNIISSPDESTAYVSSLLAGTVDVVDLGTYQTITRFAIDPEGRHTAHGIAYIPAVVVDSASGR
ncbi:YncE family protein [Nocardia terpenica]|uniref:YncE family protein n=1 Tax=Nocardia terpenica TaxID=455432 RepID=UPI002FE365BB